jgi:hypothetical protein
VGVDPAELDRAWAVYDEAELRYLRAIAKRTGRQRLASLAGEVSDAASAVSTIGWRQTHALREAWMQRPDDEELEARWEEAHLTAEKSEMLQELFAELRAAHEGHVVRDELG